MQIKSDAFWSVELGVGMGPLALGTEYDPLLHSLRDHRIDADRLRLDRSGEVSVPEIGIQLIFSQASPRTLIRIDVSDERLRFGSLAVIDKRAHEIVGLFKVPRKEKIWCSLKNDGGTFDLAPKGNTAAHSRELLAGGTIWIPSLGLGLTLRDGLIAKVHLCDPAQAPRLGSGTWTKEQQILSEVRELPADSTIPTNRNRKSILSVLIHLALAASVGVLLWRAIQIQQRWNVATEVSALVVALEPPPPSILPNSITLSFNETNGNKQHQTLGYIQFDMAPKVGDEVNVRYLPDAPNKVLGPAAFRNVGFDTALPYGIGILAIYSLLQLIVLGASPFRVRCRR